MITADHMILAIETSCDDTCAAVVTAAGEMRSNVISSQGVHDRYGGVVPEVAARHHLALVNDVVDDALRTRRRHARRRRARRRHPGARAGRRAARGRRHGQGRWPPRAACRWRRSTTSRATWRRTSSATSRSSRRSCAWSPRGGHTFLARVEDHAGYTVLGRTLDDAAGEAFDKGARMLGLPLSRRPGARAPGGRGRSRRRSTSRSPPASPGLDFSFAGLKTALLYKVRDLGDEAQARRADLAAAYQHAIVEALALRVERGARADRPASGWPIGGGVAANGPLRERMAGLGRRAARPRRARCAPTTRR